MPLVPLETLPAGARLWVFGANRPLSQPSAQRLMAEVDDFLRGWAAHGVPLTCGRSWSHDRFLTIGVDQSAAGASGCSIDGLFRSLRALEPAIGASLVGGGNVFYREPGGSVACVTRDEFSALAEQGKISEETSVFDPTVATLRDWRERFEVKAGMAWHAALL
jgi:hypothetical protein